MADSGYVSEADVRRLSDCILHLHATPAESPGFVPRVLGLVTRLTEGDSAFYGITDIGLKRTVVGLAIPQDLVTPHHAPMFDRHFDDHPFHSRPLAHLRSPVFRLSERVRLGTWRRTGLFNEFFRPAGIEHQLLARLPTSPPYAQALGAARTSRDFSTKHRLLLEVFYAHLKLSFAKGERLSSIAHEPEGAPRVRRLEVNDQGRVLPSSLDGDDPLFKSFWQRRHFGRPDSVPAPLIEWIRRGITEAGAIRPDPNYGILRVTQGTRVLECQLVPDCERNRHVVYYFELDQPNRALGAPATASDRHRARLIVNATAAWNLTQKQGEVLDALLRALLEQANSSNVKVW